MPISGSINIVSEFVSSSENINSDRAISLMIHNLSTEIFTLAHIEFWIVNERGEIWPSPINGARKLDIGVELQPNQRRNLLYILDIDNEELPMDMRVKIFRVNGRPFVTSTKE